MLCGSGWATNRRLSLQELYGLSWQPQKRLTLRRDRSNRKFGAADSRADIMTICRERPLRKWAWRSLLLVAHFRRAGGLFGGDAVEAERSECRHAARQLSFRARGTRRPRHRSPRLEFYSKALAEDPNNEVILEQAFLLETASAHWDRAIELANELVKVEPSHRIAQFLLGLRGLQAGRLRERPTSISPRRARVRLPISPRRSPAPGCRRPPASPMRPSPPSTV